MVYEGHHTEYFSEHVPACARFLHRLLWADEEGCDPQERRGNKTEQKSDGSATEEGEAAREQTQPHFVRVL